MTESHNKWFDANIEDDVAKAVIRVQIKLADGTTFTRDFRPDVDINYDALEDQLATIPSTYAYWAMVMSEQKMIVGMLERKSKHRRSVVAKTIIDTAKASGISLRGTDIKELIESDPTLEQIEAELLIAQRSAGKLWNIEEALRMKSESLRSLAGFKKQEMRDTQDV